MGIERMLASGTRGVKAGLATQLFKASSNLKVLDPCLWVCNEQKSDIASRSGLNRNSAKIGK